MRVSYIICSHRGPASLDATLESLRDETPRGEAEVILVDNGMTPGRRAELERVFAPGSGWLPGLVVTETRPGLGHARLKGFTASRGEALVWLDDDNTVGPGFHEGLSDCIRDHPRWGAICPSVWPRWEAPPEPWLVEFGVHCLSYNLLPATLPVREWTVSDSAQALRAPGGGMILHRSVMELYAENRAGDDRVKLARTGDGFDGCEDEDMFGHVWKASRNAVVDARLRVWHHIPPRRCEPSYLLRLNHGMLRSYVRLARANGSKGPRLWIGQGIIAGAAELGRGIALGWRHRRTSPVVLACARVAGRWAGLCSG